MNRTEWRSPHRELTPWHGLRLICQLHLFLRCLRCRRITVTLYLSHMSASESWRGGLSLLFPNGRQTLVIHAVPG